MRWIGSLVALGILVVGMWLGSSMGIFVNIPSLVIVIVVGTGIVVAGHGIGMVSTLFRAMFVPIGGRQRARARSAAETARQAFIGAGWLGLLVGGIQVLRVVGDLGSVGPAAATALLSVFYGYAVAYLLWMPLGRSLGDAVPSSRSRGLLAGQGSAGIRRRNRSRRSRVTSRSRA